MYCVYLGLGSNLGDRVGFLSAAVQQIKLIAEIKAVSSIYETAPVEMESSYYFHNMALSVGTTFSPPDFLGQLKNIERLVGRKSYTHLKDREIDIDILLYEGMKYRDGAITIPHPRLPGRRFVLEPLSEIAPDVVHPILHKTMERLLLECEDENSVVRTNLTVVLPQFSSGSPRAAFH